MSSTATTFLDFTTQQVTLYLAIPILITGLLGGISNIIVFLSLKTFRENSCAFYLTIMSIVNIGHLLTGLLSRILINGFNMDLTQSSIFYCKFRPYCLQLCVLISFTCMCLATIDQFLATYSKPRWQQWTHIHIAHRLIISFVILWLLHGIPYSIYYNQIPSILTSNYRCVITNEIFQMYVVGQQAIGLSGLVPVIINSLFALLAYRNIRSLTYRTIPLVRRELDKQLTIIVLIQAVYNFLATIPYLIINILTLNAIITKDLITLDKLASANILTLYIFYLNFTSPFYMYICASRRFRHQFIYVFYTMHFHRCRQRFVTVNLVAPQ